MVRGKILMYSFDILPQESQRILDSIPSLIEKTFPIPGRFRGKLPSDIAELSRLLTNNRGDRSLSYMTRPNFLSAYLHYFLPWNLYRLCLLLPTLKLNLCAKDIITDLGCGPLTLTSALWITNPGLRKIPLEINCLDRSGPALEAGKKFFTALCENTGGNAAWKINLIKEDIDIRQPNKSKKRKPAALVCAVNTFNEIYENLSHNNTEGLRNMAENAARLMFNFASPNGSILTIEPGVPQAGRFISFLRDSFMELKRPPASPCTHIESCPLIIKKGKKWCHFAFNIEDAPKELRRLSAAAKLPKERLAFSYLLTGKNSKEGTRVISDMFPLPDNLFGRYGCSAQGLVLLTGEKNRIEKLSSHDIVTPIFAANGQYDQKSGAFIVRIE